ncbi:MAG: CPBP family intramembrane metalloprotease [Agathobacter sp.]|nr:CPBP family intramembrane metalloprotease [Agathobacter sp.]
MTKLYKKNELIFALIWIGIYAIGGGVFEEISRRIGIESLAPAVYFIVLSVLLYAWISKNQLREKFGLCKPTADVKAFLWYIPLILITISNIGFGVQLKYTFVGTLCFIIKMLCVGLLEELIFRGFLFRAMCRDNIKFAIIVSSVTFGVGHILNLFNGSGMELWENLVQIVAAVAFGFLYVILFYRGGSLIPCILSHGIFNSMSAFSVEGSVTAEVIHSGIVCIFVVAYTVVLMKTLPKKEAI